MKLNPNMKLRKVGRKYMVVDASSGSVNMTNVFTFNDSAVRLWERASVGPFEAEDLARWLCEWYEVDMSTARADVEKLLRCWVDGGLVI